LKTILMVPCPDPLSYPQQETMRRVFIHTTAFLDPISLYDWMIML